MKQICKVMIVLGLLLMLAPPVIEGKNGWGTGVILPE